MTVYYRVLGSTIKAACGIKLLLMEIIEGFAALSTAKSLYERLTVRSQLDSFCAVTSPNLQNEKRVVAEASHSTVLLKEGSL